MEALPVGFAPRIARKFGSGPTKSLYAVLALIAAGALTSLTSFMLPFATFKILYAVVFAGVVGWLLWGLYRRDQRIFLFVRMLGGLLPLSSAIRLALGEPMWPNLGVLIFGVILFAAVQPRR